MSENTLKIVPAPEAKTGPAELKTGRGSAKPARSGHKRLRMTLLVALPTIAALIGSGFYIMGGRYISTDNAYVGAQKVLITPDISGKIVHVAVIEGQCDDIGAYRDVSPGDYEDFIACDVEGQHVQAGRRTVHARPRSLPARACVSPG